MYKNQIKNHAFTGSGEHIYMQQKIQVKQKMSQIYIIYPGQVHSNSKLPQYNLKLEVTGKQHERNAVVLQDHKTSTASSS